MSGRPHSLAPRSRGTSRGPGPARRFLWPALAAICVLTIVGEIAYAIGPHVEDMARLLGGGRALLSGQPPGRLLAVYPPSSVVQYLPLAMLPIGVAEFLTRLATACILVWMVASFGRDDDGRIEPWALVLLVSPPAINAVRLDQFNAALALFALIVAWRLLRSGRPLLAGLVAGIAATRPLNALPVGLGLIGAAGRGQRLRLLAGSTAFVGMTLAASFAWDPNLFRDIVTTSEHRSLVGVVGFMRTEFGVIGVCVWLVIVGMLCMTLSNGLRDRPRDAFVLVLAVSTFAVHLGGPYAALFALPAVARLAATVSPWWAVATTLGYATLVTVASPLTLAWAIHGDVVFALVLAPLGFAAASVSLVYGRMRVPERALTLAPQPLLVSVSEDGRFALGDGVVA
jgi:Glycosyltransferase family 87